MDFTFRIIDRNESVIWCGEGRKEANSAFKEVASEMKCNFIRLQEQKKGVYVTIKGTCT